jgi:hypothetical protein
MREKRAVFITGSGKCGTSLVAHSFFSSGFPMGTEEELIIYRGGIGNINGYWEHAKILELNREILAQNGNDWFSPPTSLPLKIDEPLRVRMGELAATLPDGFCCKDPRLVWTADLWANWFTKPTIVAVYRNPTGFRRSIANVWPDQFSADGSQDSRELRIWEASNRRLLDLASRFPCHWICFDEPFDVLKATLERIINQLGGNFNSAEFERSFIPGERRFSSDDDLDASRFGLPEPHLALYRELALHARRSTG